jgi:hypothetical protein
VAQLFSADFESGSNGTTITTSNSPFTNLVQSGWTYSNTQVLASGGGSLSGRCAATGSSVQANVNFTAGSLVYARWYMYVDALPGSTTTVAQLSSSGTVRGEVRLTSGGAVQTRNSSSVQVALSGNIVTAGSWFRVEWMWDNTNTDHRLLVYVGANVHGTTPDYDSGVLNAVTTGTANRFHVGVMNATTATWYFDEFNLDDAAFAAPSYSAPPTTIAPSSISSAGGTGTPSVNPQTIVAPLSIPASTYADQFSAIGSRWDAVAGTPTIAAERLRLNYITGYDEINASSAYDLNGGSITVENLVSSPVPTWAEAYFGFVDFLPTRFDCWFELRGSNIRAVLGSTTLATVTNNASARWLRIRTSGTAAYFDTSPDGQTWTQVATTTMPRAAKGAIAYIGAGNYNGGGTDASYAEFDNFAMASAPGTPAATPRVTSSPASITATSGVGTPTVSFGTANQTAELDGIVATGGVGTPAATAVITAEPAGILAESGLGEPSVAQLYLVHRFTPPYVHRHYPIEGALVATYQFGLAVLRVDGQWIETEFPSERQVAEADYFYSGGSIHEVDADTAAVLTAAGYDVVSEFI